MVHETRKTAIARKTKLTSKTSRISTFRVLRCKINASLTYPDLRVILYECRVIFIKTKDFFGLLQPEKCEGLVEVLFRTQIA